MPKPPGTPGATPAKVRAADDSLSGVEDVPFVILASDLLANDTDPFPNDGNALRITSVQSGTGGTVHLVAASQKVVFTPTEDFNGGATFTYTVSDGRTSATAMVTVAVAPTVDNFTGNTFRYEAVFDPSDGPPDIGKSQDVTGVIETSDDQLPEIENFNGSTVHNFANIDFDGDRIIFDFITAGGGFTDGDFNGIVIHDIYGQLDSILGVNILKNTMENVTADNISFTANSVSVDFGGAGSTYAYTEFELQLVFG